MANLGFNCTKFKFLNSNSFLTGATLTQDMNVPNSETQVKILDTTIKIRILRSKENMFKQALGFNCLIIIRF